MSKLNSTDMTIVLITSNKATMVKIWLYLAPPGLGWCFIHQQDNRNKSNANIPWSDASPESAVCMQCCSGSVNNYTDGDTAATRLSPCSADNTHYSAVLQCLCQFLLSEGILVPERTFNMPLWQKRLWPLSIHNKMPHNAQSIVSNLSEVGGGYWTVHQLCLLNYSIYLVLMLKWSIIGSSLGGAREPGAV